MSETTLSPKSTVLNEPLTVHAGALALLAATLWGGMNISIKLSLDGIPPLALAAMRFVIGIAVVLVWTSLNRVPIRMEDGEKRGMVQLALLFVLQIGVLNIGTHFTLASRSTVLNSTHPFFTAVFAHLFLTGDRLSRLKVIGMGCSFLGVVVIFSESIAFGDFQYLKGDLLMLSSGMLLGLRLVYTKRLAQGMHPGKLLVWQSSLSIPIFFILSAVFENDFNYRFDAAVVLGVLYQGVVIAGFCFILWTTLLRRYMASRLGVFHFVTPVFGVLFSNLLLGEPISYGIIASMVLVGIGIAVVNSEG
jgi:drug/metabolite transporter (DMT)-like permease